MVYKGAVQAVREHRHENVSSLGQISVCIFHLGLPSIAGETLHIQLNTHNHVFSTALIEDLLTMTVEFKDLNEIVARKV